MCTLIIARDVLGRGTMLLGANRDERPERASLAPAVLIEDPRIVGGRDQVAGGTWLALRPREELVGGFAVALLNRRDPSFRDPPKDRRSRGLLTLDVARASQVPDDLDVGNVLRPGLTTRETAQRLVQEARYAPFSLVYASAHERWILVHDDARDEVAEITPGWHVLTHMDLDDPGEPRTAHLLARLQHERPSSPAAAEALVAGLLRSHGEDGGPPVCLHEGVMRTVSSSLVWIDLRNMRYLHSEGRPCEHEYRDVSALLTPAGQPGGRS